MKYFYIFSGLLFAFFSSTSLSWEIGIQQERFNANRLEDGEKTSLTLIHANPGVYQAFNTFTYNTNFGLEEKIWNGQLTFFPLEKVSSWIVLSLGADAVASSKYGLLVGASHQTFNVASFNLAVDFRRYLNADAQTFIFGLDYESPINILLVPRVYFGNVEYDAGTSGDTLSWSIRAVYLYQDILQPYIYFGRGKEIDFNIGAIASRTLDTETYGIGTKIKLYKLLVPELAYEYRKLDPIDLNYKIIRFSLGMSL